MLTPEDIEQVKKIAFDEAASAARRFALLIREEDGAPAVRSLKALKVTNGALTYNADGTASLAAGVAADGSITGAKLATGDHGYALIAGGAAGNHTVTGTATGDELLFVLHFTAGAAMADLTGEFTISGANTINNTGGTDTTGDQLIVVWISKA